MRRGVRTHTAFKMTTMRVPIWRGVDIWRFRGRARLSSVCLGEQSGGAEDAEGMWLKFRIYCKRT